MTSPLPALVWLQAVSKTVLILAYFAAWFWVYDAFNSHSSDPAHTIHWTAPRELMPQVIQPSSALVYVFGGFVLPALPFLYHGSWPGIRFVLCCYTVTSLLAFACYWAFPLSMVRPAHDGNSIGERLMSWVFTKDQPGNCFPSSHTFFAVLGAMLVARRERRLWVRVVTWSLAVAVCVSTVTTGQHYFIDIPGGVAAAVFGYAVTRRLLPDA